MDLQRFESRDMDDSMALEIAKCTAKNIFDIFGGLSTVTVWDTEKLLVYYESPEIKLGVKVYDKMSPKTAAYKCITTKQRVVLQASKEHSAFGVAYMGMAIPIINNNRVIGALAITSPMSKQQILTDMAQSLHETSIQTLKASEGIASSASDIASSVEKLFVSAEDAKKELSTIGEVINLIKQISDQTRLLSLNAAIESARAGEAGKGFGVVANEIKKLAQGTAGNVSEISKKLMSISNAVEAIAGKIGELESLAQNQAASTEEISASMNSLDYNSQKIIEVAKSLSN